MSLSNPPGQIDNREISQRMGGKEHEPKPMMVSASPGHDRGEEIEVDSKCRIKVRLPTTQDRRGDE